jgi:hypothetical protein
LRVTSSTFSLTIISFSFPQSIETTNDPDTYVFESGSKVVTLFDNGNFCEPESLTIKEEGKDKFERHKELVEHVVNEARMRMEEGKSKSKSKVAGPKGKAKKASAKKKRDSDMPPPKKSRTKSN